MAVKFNSLILIFLSYVVIINKLNINFLQKFVCMITISIIDMVEHSVNIVEHSVNIVEHSEVMVEHSEVMAEHSLNMVEHSIDMGEHSMDMGEHSVHMGEHSKDMVVHFQDIVEHYKDIVEHSEDMVEHSEDTVEHSVGMVDHSAESGHELSVIMFLVFLMLFCLSNLFSWMTRRYFNSVLEVNRSLIMLINGYMIVTSNWVVTIFVSI